MTIHDLVFSQSAFSPGVAAALKSTTAAIALASLMCSTKPRDIPLLPKEREDALSRLRHLQLITSETDQKVVVDAAAVGALLGLAGVAPKRGPAEVLIVPPPATFVEILNGAFDALPKGRLAAPTDAMLTPMVEAWGKLWGRPQVRVTPQRRRYFVRYCRDGGKPSAWCKSILGMKHDDWPDRAKHCDWDAVAKSADRWFMLFGTLGMPKKTTEADGALLRNVKTVKVDGVPVAIPLDYVWTQADEHMHKQGYTLDLTTSKWVRAAKVAK